MPRAAWLLLALSLCSCGQPKRLGAECVAYLEEVQRFCDATRERPGTREACAELEAQPARWQGELAQVSEEAVSALEARCQEARSELSILLRAEQK